jgi:hypothetical protein
VFLIARNAVNLNSLRSNSKFTGAFLRKETLRSLRYAATARFYSPTDATHVT